MTVSSEELRPRVQAFDFPRLVVEGLGSDHYFAKPPDVHVDESDYALKPIAERASFAILECFPRADVAILKKSLCRKIETFSHEVHDQILDLTVIWPPAASHMLLMVPDGVGNCFLTQFLSYAPTLNWDSTRFAEADILS